MNDTSFKQQQEIVEDIKADNKERVSDEYIEQVIENLSAPLGPKDVGNFTTVRPIVEMTFRDGQEVDKKDLEMIMKYNHFPHKKRVMKEIRKGRAKGFVKEGKLILKHIDDIERDNANAPSESNIKQADNGSAMDCRQGG